MKNLPIRVPVFVSIIAVLFLAPILSSRAGQIIWTNTSGGNWNDPNNWRPNQVPASASDDAVIAISGTYVVTLDVAPIIGSLTLGGVSGQQTLLTSGLTLTLNAASVVNSNGIFGLSGGELAGPGVLTVQGQFLWTAGDTAATAVINVETNGLLAVMGSGAGNIYNSFGMLTNAGTMRLTNVSLQMVGACDSGLGVIVNLPGGLIDIQDDSSIQAYCTTEMVLNYGTIRKSGGLGMTTIGGLNNFSVFDVQTGSVNLNAGGAGNGVWTAEAGTTLAFNGGNFYLDGTVTGAGTNVLSSGLFALGGSLSGAHTILQGGSLGGTNGYIRGFLTWIGGDMPAGTTLTVAATGVLTVAGGSLYNMFGMLTNAGTLRLNDGNIQLVGGCDSGIGLLDNLPGGVIDFQSDNNITGYCVTETILNQGTVRKSGGAGTSIISGIFNNTGTVDVQSGTLSINNGGIGNGVFAAEAGGTLTYGGGVSEVDSGFTGAGAVVVTAGTLLVNGSINSTNFILAGGTLGGTNLVINSSMNWINGSIGGAGLPSNLTVTTNGVMAVAASLGLSFNLFGGLTNAGTVLLSNVTLQLVGPCDSGAGEIINLPGGLVDFQDDSTIHAYCSTELFLNQGTVRKSGGNGISLIDSSLQNTGTVDAETGTISLSENYSLTNGALVVGVNSQTNFGQIALAGTAALDGSFNAYLNHGFIPTNNSSFNVVTFGASTGDFTSVRAANPPIWQTNFSSGAMTLTTVSTIAWATPADIIYGTPLGGAQLDSVAGTPGTYIYAPPAGTVLSSGLGRVLNLSFLPNDPSFLPTTLQVSLNVQKAPLTITANSRSKIYGQTVTFAGTEFTPTGLVNGDTTSSANLASGGAAATAQVSGSPFLIVPSGITGSVGLSNYNLTFANGSLTVTPAPLTITANSRGKTYGQTVTFTGTEFTTSGLLNSDSATSVTLTSSGAAATAQVSGSPAAIVPSAAVGSGLGNYAITYVNGSLTIATAPLTITANNRSKIYGQTVTFAGTEFTPAGLLNGDTVTSVTLASSGAAATALVSGSPFSIVPSAAVGARLANYTISYANGSLSVTTAPLTITANNQSKTYGQTVTFAGTEFTPAGLLNGDTVTSVTLASAGAAATAQVSGSPFSIVPSAAVGAKLANYTISYANGALSLTTAPLTITANSTSKTYGQTVIFAGSEFTPVGLLNGDTVTSVSLASGGAAATAHVSGSPYSIVPSAAVGAKLVNYTINYANGSLTINRAPLTITANNRTKVLGQTVTFAGTEFTPSGLQNSDTILSVTLTSTGAAASAPVNTYPIIPSAATGGTFNANDYTIAYQNGTLTVNPPPTLQFSVQGGALVLSWLTNAGAFTLQTSTNLSSPANWRAATNVIHIIGVQNFATNALSGNGAFFELKL